MYRSSLQYRQAEQGVESNTLPHRENLQNGLSSGEPGSRKTIFQTALRNCKPQPHETVRAVAEKSICDQQIAELFGAMRRASRLDSIALAYRLETTPEIITALETGNLSQLPEWETIARVVTAYAQIINVEDKPILRRLRERLTSHFLNQLSHESYNANTNFSGQFKSGALKPANKNVYPQKQANGMSPFPSTDNNLKALAEGRQLKAVPNAKKNAGQAFQPLSNGPGAAQNNRVSIEQTISQLNDLAQNLDGVKPNSFAPNDELPKKRFGFLAKLFMNFSFVVVLLVGFIYWQPNRFWSGVDQLPKPVSETIYSIYEYLMPDPFASSYRMNWVKVEDPRLRKADKLAVPPVKKLPPIDFSKFGRQLIK